jgi:hypothetical protein
MTIILGILAALVILGLLLGYSCCVVAGRADDWADIMEARMVDSESD